jgi:alpha-D-xyloside xylohydrolase
MKYRLMPYVYTQAAISSKNGWPLLKALLLNYPNDPTAWLIEDQYLFGDDILVAPLLEENTTARLVYLPEGKWIDYQTKEVFAGNQWHMVSAGEVPGIVFVKHGSLIPHIPLAQSTAFMDWTAIELVAFADAGTEVNGKYYTQETGEIVELQAVYADDGWKLTNKQTQQGQTIFPHHFPVVPSHL